MRISGNGEILYPQVKDVAVWQTQGPRPTMEDFSIIKSIGSQPVCLFMAVYDGHAGVQTAEYLAGNLDQRLKENVETLPNLTASQLFEKTFMKIETELYDSWVKAGRKRSGDSGSTACVVLINDRSIFVANTGDCRCVITSQDSMIFESLDHKATLPSELARIQNAGGFVHQSRINGELAVSRAFGDFNFKAKIDLPLKNQMVTAFPDVTEIPRSDLPSILILASDGVWDVVSSSEASVIAWSIRNSGRDALRAAQTIVENAIRKGTKDNVSCIVSFL